MTDVYKFTDNSRREVLVVSGDNAGLTIRTSDMLWGDLGISDLIRSGDILPSTYEVPTTVDEAYAAKYVEINAWRDKEIKNSTATVEVSGVTYQADIDSRAIIVSYVASGYIPASFRDNDNNNVIVTSAMLKEILTAINVRTDGIHSRMCTLKTTLEELYATEDITADEIESLQVCYESEEVELIETDSADDSAEDTEETDTAIDDTGN